VKLIREKKNKFIKYILIKKNWEEKKMKGEEDIPEHGGVEERREEKEMDIDVFYIWRRWRRRRKETGLLWN